MRVEQRTTLLTFLLSLFQTCAVCVAEVFNHIPIFVLRTAVAWLHASKEDVVKPGNYQRTGFRTQASRLASSGLDHWTIHYIFDTTVAVV
jgi:hypothetical protein